MSVGEFSILLLGVAGIFIVARQVWSHRKYDTLGATQQAKARGYGGAVQWFSNLLPRSFFGALVTTFYVIFALFLFRVDSCSLDTGGDFHFCGFGRLFILIPSGMIVQLFTHKGLFDDTTVLVSLSLNAMLVYFIFSGIAFVWTSLLETFRHYLGK